MNKNLRIAFCGASGTGKTTTADILSKKLDLEVCPVGSRTVSAEMGFDSPYDVDAFGKRKDFQYKLMNLKQKWESQKRSYITDRTHIDNLVYSIMHDCVYTVTRKFVDDAYLYSMNYTHIVYFPVSSFINIDSDPKRVGNKEYHLVYDHLLYLHLKDMIPQCKILELNKWDLQERVEDILNWIDGKRNTD